MVWAWGIIQSIVSRYSGSLTMDDHGDSFETKAMLFLRKPSAAAGKHQNHRKLRKRR